MPLFTPELEFSDDYPTIEPSLKLDFANARALDPRITFTRASTATYVGRDGLIKTAGDDEARFDHDPVTGESLGLLIEKTAINLITTSEDLSDAAWFKNNSSIQSNSIVSPSGDTTADKVFDDTTTGATHSISLFFAKLAVFYTGSVYVKAGEYTKVALGFVGVSNWDGTPQALFDLSTGQVISTGAGSPTANITAVGNGWYKCVLTAESLNTTSSRFSIGIISDSGTNTGGGGQFLGHDGDGSSGLYIWGAQVESGSFPTSYIPTSGSVETRTKDVAGIFGESFKSFHNYTEHSLLVDYVLDKNAQLISPLGTNQVRFCDAGGGGSNGVNGYSLRVVTDPTTPQIDARASYDFTIYFDNAGINLSNGVNEYKVAMGFALNDQAFVSGSTVQTDNTVALPSPIVLIERLVIGELPTKAHYKKIVYYPKRLTNTQLQTLTQ